MTHRWEVDDSRLDVITVKRAHDHFPVFTMSNSDWWMTREQQVDVAQQIVDDWNFSCDDLGDAPRD